MLKLRKLEKYFETKAGRIYVLRNIDLDVASGEFLTIMGPSGAGKSSLLGILGMLDGAWSGEYYLLDQPVHRLNLKQRAELNKRNIGKSTRLNSSHLVISYAVFCLKKK